MIQKLKTIIIITFFSFLLICCESKSNKISEFIGTYKIELSSDSILINSASLKILEKNKYEYFGEDLKMNKRFFSFGTWNVNNDTLTLKTVENNDCYFVNKTISFQCDNFENDDYTKIVTKPYLESNVTVKNCIPKDSNKFYTNLNEEKFLLENNKLQYKRKKNDCFNYFPEITLSITKQN